jgi:hypothetical protein
MKLLFLVHEYLGWVGTIYLFIYLKISKNSEKYVHAMPKIWMKLSSPIASLFS